MLPAAHRGRGRSGYLALAEGDAWIEMGHARTLSDQLLPSDPVAVTMRSIDMFPEDGCLRVYDVGEDGVTAFTQYGIECLRQIIADERAAGNAPPPVKPTE
jgi:hypothetical protein